MALTITEKTVFSSNDECNERRKKILEIFMDQPERVFLFQDIRQQFDKIGPTGEKSLRRDIKYLVTNGFITGVILLRDTRRIGYQVINNE